MFVVFLILLLGVILSLYAIYSVLVDINDNLLDIDSNFRRGVTLNFILKNRKGKK